MALAIWLCSQTGTHGAWDQQREAPLPCPSFLPSILSQGFNLAIPFNEYKIRVPKRTTVYLDVSFSLEFLLGTVQVSGGTDMKESRLHYR